MATKKTSLQKVMAKKAKEKKDKTIFVIMPFTETPTRNKTQLTAFFENDIKQHIESGEFEFQYHVRRSDETFNITEQIIKDLYTADIVICDLSGQAANPNVMYELGIRLAFSNKPVILIREAHKDNKPIFDIGGFYAEPYDPFNYSALREHFTSKINRLESRLEIYSSPILKIVGQDQPLLVQMSANRAAQLLDTLADALHMNLRMLGGHIHMFLMSRKPPVNLGTKEVLDLLFQMQKQAAKLNQLDWSTFHYLPGAQPTLDHYLSTRYLFGLVEQDIEQLYTSVLLEYHGQFMGTDIFTMQWSPGKIYGYYLDTALIRSATNALIKILISKDVASVELAKKAARQFLTEKLKES